VLSPTSAIGNTLILKRAKDFFVPVDAFKSKLKALAEAVIRQYCQTKLLTIS
jgi:hypothetical protein